MSCDDGKHTGPGGGCNLGDPRTRGFGLGGFGPRGPRPGGFGPGGFGPRGPRPRGCGPGGFRPGGFGPRGPRPGGFGPGGPRPGGHGPRGHGPEGHGPGSFGPGGHSLRGPSPRGPCPGPKDPCPREPCPGPEIVPETPLKPAKKLGGKGGDEGDIWDDGVFDGVRKVYVGQYLDGVSFLKIEYYKGSQIIIGDGHGKQSMLEPETIELDYPSEYIIALKGKYDTFHQEKGGSKTWVTTLTFVTNKQTTRAYGLDAGEAFEIKEEGKKIVGFHGKAGDFIHQIGVYVVPITD